MTSCNMLLLKSQPLRYSSQLMTGMVMAVLPLVCKVMPLVVSTLVNVTLKVREFWNSPQPMVSMLATPGSRRETLILLLTTPAIIQPSLTIYSVLKVSAAQSTM